MRICSEIHSISWHNNELAQVVSQNSGWRLIPASSRRHGRRRFQIHCVLLHCAISSLHSTNRRLAFQISPTHSSRFRCLASKLVRLEHRAEFGYLTCPLDPWRSAFTGSIDSARSQPFLLLKLLKAFQRFWAVCCTVLQRVNSSGCSSPSILHDVLHHRCCCCCCHDCCNHL